MVLHFTRSARIWLSRSLIVSLLFLQLASAAYACTVGTTVPAADAMAGMPCAQAMSSEGVAAMDPEEPGLCHEHCKGSGTQTVEPAAMPALAVSPRVMLFVLAAPGASAGTADGWRARRVERDSAPPPSHAILHCCFRI